eukprot:gb/GFBE01048275.1/.p1 GENE.gb/GFBE01048275.1/~~gb/GFBE01048275.1/.p1  ORF type:complete len:307 (+),score=78.41 gb/GFBE01048275.1/:1-921(+)
MARPLRLLAAALSLASGLLVDKAAPRTLSAPQSAWQDALEMLAEEAEDEAEAEQAASMVMSFAARDDLNGFERAKAANTCSMKYKAMAHAKNAVKYDTPMVMVNRSLHTAYLLQGKSASSTIRETMRALQGVQDDLKDLFRFSIVRDPLDRTISTFWEEGRNCVGLDESAFHLNKDDAAHQATVLRKFEEYVQKLEEGKCWGPHATGQRARLPDSKEFPVDFVGLLSNLKQEWRAIAEHQASTFNVIWPELPAKKFRVGMDAWHELLNPRKLSSDVANRACRLYRDDYCCLKLPLPPQCQMDSCAE